MTSCCCFILLFDILSESADCTIEAATEIGVAVPREDGLLVMVVVVG